MKKKKIASEISVSAGANFIKTSTGFSSYGATEDDVRLIRKSVGPDIGVKASGGVKTLSSLNMLVEAGANRIGTSSALSIIDE